MTVPEAPYEIDWPPIVPTPMEYGLLRWGALRYIRPMFIRIGETHCVIDWPSYEIRVWR